MALMGSVMLFHVHVVIAVLRDLTWLALYG